MDSIAAAESIDNEAVIADYAANEESLDIVVRMIRDGEKFSFLFASSMPILRIEKDHFQRHVVRRFAQQVTYFDRSFRSDKLLIDLTMRKPCVYHVHQSLKFLNDMMKSEGYSPKISPSINVEKDCLPFDMCSRLGET